MQFFLKDKQFEIVRLLLADERIKFTLSSQYVRALLFEASSKGALDIVKALLKKNINSDTLMHFAKPLFIASQNGRFNVVDYFLQIENIDFSKPYIGKMDALKNFAVKHCVGKAMGVLINAKLEAGCNPDEIPITPIEIASIMGYPNIVQRFEEQIRKSDLHFDTFKLG